MPAAFLVQVPHHANLLKVLIKCPVRKIEPGHIHPGAHHLPKDTLLGRRRAERANDLCRRHGRTYKYWINWKYCLFALMGIVRL